MIINKALTVNRSNNLVQASYYLTLNEKRLIEACIAKVSTKNGIPDRIEITAEEFCTAFPAIKPNESYKALKLATSELYERSVKIMGEKLGEEIDFRWIDAKVRYSDDEAKVSISFTKWVKPYLSELQGGYTTYRLLDIGRLKSAHAIRLYELLMRYQDTGFRVDKLSDLKEYFGIADKYSEWYEFNRWVLKPSVKNINESSNWKVTYSTKKKGRKIDLVAFKFHLKDQPLLDL